MLLFRKAKHLNLIFLNPHVVTCRTKYLFIFSHMRSRSSVLSHVLGSNPAVCGYSELHLNYLDRISILKMRIKLYLDLRCELRNKYLLDKILHNSYTVSNEILEITKPKVIFLLRDSNSTIKSLINTGFITGIEWLTDPNKALDYYCSRLSFLERYAKMIGGGYFFLEACDLVDKTDYVLDDLSEWLDLDKPLDRHYTIFPNTGKIGYGDPSLNIASGVIKETKDHPDIKVPLEILQIAESAYEKCKHNLLKDASSRNITVARA